MLYVYNMSLFLDACLLNRGQKASSANSADLIEAEIEVSQRCALRQASCKPLCPACSYLMAKSKQCKVPTKQGQRLDHATKLEAFLPRQCRSNCH